jgi:uncharacterized protein YjiS (DUF1127 family)
MPVSRHSHPAILTHVWQAIGGTLKALAEGAATARRAARVYEQLTAMSDPELHDIGIHRSDIPAVVSGTYLRRPWSLPDSRD